jgi:hypothetical protein
MALPVPQFQLAQSPKADDREQDHAQTLDLLGLVFEEPMGEPPRFALHDLLSQNLATDWTYHLASSLL